MTCNNIILAKPEAGASVPYTLPEGESARLSFGPEDISGISMTPQGGLVIDFLEGGELTLTNFQSMVDGGNLLYLADGTLVDPAVLQAAVASNIETASGEGDATVIGIPAKDTTQEYTIEAGKDYVLDFDINTPVNAVKQDGDFIMTFENGGLVVLRGYDVAMASAQPAKLTTTSDVCVYEGDELITNIQQLAAAPSEELLVEEEEVVEEEETAKSKIEDADLVGQEDVGPGDETALGYNAEQQVADIEPAAGDEVAEQLAQVEPAAGEPGASNSGYGLNSSPGSEPFNDKADTGPIDPTALGYSTSFRQEENRFVSRASAAPAAVSKSEVLDESDLDNGPLSVSDTLVVDFGNDTPGRILPNGQFNEGGSLDNNDLSHEGSPITVTINQAGDGYEGRDGNGVLIFDFVINESTGEYTFNLYETLDHADPNDANDIITLDFGIVAVDADNDQVNTVIRVSILDDAPIILNQPAHTIDETDFAGGANSASGTFFADMGEDTPAAFTGNDNFSASGSVAGGNLTTSGGNDITVTFDAGTQTYTGTATINGNLETIFTLVIDTANAVMGPPASVGYTYTQYFGFDHADSNDPNDVITLKFGIDAVDFDDDAIEGFVTINVLDDVPVINDSRGDVDETNFDQGDLTYTSTVTSTTGADLADVRATGSFTSSTALESNGVAVTVALSGNTYTATAGAITVFTLTIDPATGQYVYTQFADLDHPDTGDNNDLISLNFGIEIEDVDGDSGNATITIDVADDGPVANDDTTGAEESQIITGNLVANDELSQDDPNTITNVRFNGTDHAVPNGGSATITGTYGTLVVNSDGSYTYTANSNNPDGTDVFTYTLVDDDGDSDTANLSVEVTPDGEPVAVYGNDLVDETNLVANNNTAYANGNLTIDFGADGAGSAGASDPNGSNGFSFSGSALNGQLTHQGAPIDVSLNQNGVFVATALVGGVGKTIFTLKVNADGSYEFDLLETLDHADGTDPNDVITLSFGVYAQDADGDQTEGRLDIQVYDDAPVAYDDVTSAEEGQLITGNVLENDVLSQDDTNFVSEIFFLDATGTPAAAAIPKGGDVTVTTQYGEMTFRSDGTYTYEASDNDPDGTDSFTYRLVDNDGDSDLAVLDIRVTPDGTPVAVSGEGDRDETTDLGVTLTEQIDVNFGTATPAGIEGNGNFTFGGSTAATLTSNGLPVTVNFDANTQTYTGSTTAGTVFTLVINANGTYSFTLEDTLDHADITDPNDAINLHFGLDAVDVDGNAVSGNIDIIVYDDAPVAYDDGPVAVQENQTVTGNVTTNDDLSEDMPNAVSEVIFNGVTTSVPANGNNVTITGQYGVLTINKDGVYSYKANNNNPQGTDVFTYVLEDGEDGDRDTAEITFNVATDDDPVIVNGANAVDETDMNPTTSVSGTVDVDYGVDAPGSVVGNDIFSFSGSVAGGNLTSDGVDVTVDYDANTGTYTGSAGATTVFTLVIEPDGDYTFTLIEPLDHADPNDPNDIINLTFGITAEDDDGDKTNGHITIKVLDDVPSINDSRGDVDETNFDQGNLTYTSTVTSVSGADVSNVAANGTFTSSDATLTSNGVTVNVTRSGNTYTGKAGAVTVFTLTIDPNTGKYVYTQMADLDHPDTGDNNDIISLNFGISITDVDSDVDTATITIDVADDGPVANDDTTGAEESQVITGNLVANDELSQDDPNTITNVRFNGTDHAVPNGGSVTVTGTYGSLVVNSDGSYTYTANGNNPDGTDVFTYTLRDDDGDTDTATLSVEVTPDGEPVAVYGDNSVDETNMVANNGTAYTNGNLTVDFGADGAGTVGISAPNGPNGFSFSGSALNNQLTHNGTTITVTANGNSFTGKAGALTVFTLTVNADGSYAFNLLETLDHADDTDPNDVINLSFGVYAEDADGDQTEGRLDIQVYDDAPVAYDDVTSAEEGQLITGDVLENDVLSQDEQNTVTQIEYVDANGATQTATIPNGGDVTVTTRYGEMTFRSDGTYTYEASDNDPDGLDEFTYTLVDSDGDSDTAQLDIRVTPDGTPVAVSGEGDRDETTDLGVTLTEAIDVNFGTATPAGIEGNGNFTFGGSTAATLTSNGLPVTVNFNPANQTYTGSTTAGTVFTLSINPNGTYSFTLVDTLDHADITDPNDAINLHFGLDAVDVDGNAVSGNIDIIVYDDAPVAYDDGPYAVTEAQTVTGNVTANDDLSEDMPNAVSEVIFNGVTTAVPANGNNVTITGQYGVLTINKDGVYSYKANSNNPNGTDVFTYVLEDGEDGDRDTAEISFNVTEIDDQPVITTENNQVDETNMNPAVSVSDTIDVNFGGDGPGTVVFTNGFTSSTGLTSHGAPVTVSLSGNTYTGTAGGNTVFTVTLNPNTGAYTFTLNEPLDHPNSNNPNDTINLDFPIRATDADGDNDTDRLRITVFDDGPVIGDSNRTIDETNMNPTASVNGTVTHDFGEDGAGVIRGKASGFTATGSVDNNNLSSEGSDVTVSFNAGDNKYTGTAADGRVVFTLEIDLSNGDYTFNLLETLDHKDDTDPDDILNLNFPIEIVDYDGDIDPGVITINVKDDGPTIGDSSGTVDESNFGSGNLTHSGTVPSNFGGATADIEPNGSFTSSTALLSRGVAVTVTETANGYVGKAGSVTVFTLTINPNTGAYTYTQLADLDHPNANNHNDAIDLFFGVEVESTSGATDDGTIKITVLDDGPNAVDDVRNPNDGQTITGNVTSNDDLSYDDPNTVTKVVFGGTTYNVPTNGNNVTINGTYGTLTINKTGAYTYVAGNNNNGGVDTFTYTLQDRDGDVDTAKLYVTVAPDTAPTGVTGSDQVDESALSGGVITETGSVSVNYGADTPGTLTATGANTFSSGGNKTGGTLSHNGTPISVTLSGNTYTGKAGGTTIFTMKINSNGTYEFKLYENLDHSLTNNDNEPITLNFGVTATDSDGDSANGTVTITVLDDAPNAVNDNGGSVALNATVTGNVRSNDDQGEDNPAYVTKVGSTNIPSNGSDVTINGTYGKLTISRDGVYSYKVNSNSTGGTDTFTYTLTDSDGDSDTATITFTAAGQPDDRPDPKNDFCTLILPHTGFSSNVLSNDDFGRDGPGSVKSVTYNGTVYNLNGGSRTITLDIGTLVIAASGAYSFTVASQSVEASTRNLTITVQDSDGDTANSTLQINIIDDNTQGTGGQDTYNGTSGADYFDGNGGDDWIYGEEGNDELYGGAGNDQVEGDIGNDKVYGDSGNDLLIGREGHDTIYGGTGNDDIYGDAGLSVGYSGNDTIYGEDGDDYIFGGGGDDTIDGGSDNDEIYGGTGSDNIQGGSGNDVLYGDNGATNSGHADTIRGGAGNDHIIGEGGNDTLYGDSGADTFWFFSVSEGVDRIKDFSRGEGDKLELSNIITNYNHGSENINDFLTAVYSGGNTTLYANNNGNGSLGSALVILEGVNVTVNQLMNGGHIIH